MAKKSKQWISVYRSLLEQPYARKPQYLSIWIYLLLNASYTNREIIRNNEKIKLKRGELVITYREIALFYSIPLKVVFNAIQLFKKLEQIKITSVKRPLTGYCVIKILNYSKYQNYIGTNIETNKETNSKFVSFDDINNYEDDIFEEKREDKREEKRKGTKEETNRETNNKFVSPDNINNYEDDILIEKRMEKRIEKREDSQNPPDFAPKNAKSEKALNIIYRNKDFSNKGANKNNNKEDFYFSPPFLKNSILSIFKEEYNESRGMDYIVLNEQKELSAIQGLLTAYLRQNGNSEYTEEKTLNEFRAYFKKCLRIQNNFYKTNLSLSLIANKFNEIMQVIKKEGIEAPEIEAIKREEFYNNLKLH